MLLGAALSACIASPSQGALPSAGHPTPSITGAKEPGEIYPEPAAASAAAPPACELPPVVVPTMPAERPGYAQLDASTGLHVTGRARQIDLADYRIEVAGKVAKPLSLTYDELRCMPRIADSPLLVCPGFFEDQAAWAGASLAHILDLAVVAEDATTVRLVGADRYEALVTLDQVRESAGFLAYEWEGEPLPVLQGFPVRAVFPDLEGNKWVKWVVKIEVY